MLDTLSYLFEYVARWVGGIALTLLIAFAIGWLYGTITEAISITYKRYIKRRK